MSTFLKVRGIGVSKHKSAEFTALSLYFSGKNDAGQLVYITPNYEIHLVKGLQANLLIGNDILLLEGVVINIGRKSALIESYKVIISVNAKEQEQFLTRKLLAG